MNLWQEIGYWESKKELNACAKRIAKEQRKAKAIYIEKPDEVAEMHGLRMTGFEILSKGATPDENDSDHPWCADEEIYIDFQGKEMRIYINDEGKLAVYTD